MLSVGNARNVILHGESSTNLTQACRWAYDTTADLIQIATAARSCSKVKSQAHWQRPHQGCYKFNVDASYNADDMNGISGVIIRDEQGHIVATSRIWHEFVPDSLTAEALACRHTTDVNLEHKTSHIGNKFDGAHFALEDEAPTV